MSLLVSAGLLLPTLSAAIHPDPRPGRKSLRAKIIERLAQKGKSSHRSATGCNDGAEYTDAMVYMDYELGEQLTDCATTIAPQGRLSALLPYEVSYSISADHRGGCAGGICHVRVTYRLVNATTGATVVTGEHWLTPAIENDPTWYCEVGDYGSLGCFKYLMLLPDIAQAAEDAELPLRLELTLEPLGTGPLFAGLGASLYPDAPTVESLTFDYEPATATDDAYTIAIDDATAIQPPEWKRLDKEKPATSEDYDDQTVAPAAYLADQPLKLKAQFRCPTGFEQNFSGLTISASTTLGETANPSPYGNLQPQTVTFHTDPGTGVCLSDEIVFTSDQSATAVAVDDIKIRWQADSLPPEWWPSSTEFGLRKTQHRIYTLLAEPVEPMLTPWAKVLELSSGMLAGKQPGAPEAEIVTKLAVDIHNSVWTQFQTRFFEARNPYQYDPRYSCSSCNDFGATIRQTFNLSEILTRLAAAEPEAPVEMQCSDSADLHSVLAASQGTTVHPIYLKHKTDPLLSATKIYARAGPIPVCFEEQFNYHQTPSLALGFLPPSQIQVDGAEEPTFVRRISLFVFEFTWKLRITNNGPAANNLQAKVSSLDAVVYPAVPEDVLHFGNVAAGASALSTDTFTIHWNRTRPWDLAKLQFDFSVSPEIYDTSIQRVTEQGTMCFLEPVPTRYYMGILFPQYLAQVFTAQTEENTLRSKVIVDVGDCPCRGPE